MSDDPLYDTWLRVKARYPKWPATFDECAADVIIWRQLRVLARTPQPKVIKKGSWNNLPEPRPQDVDIKRRASGEKDDE